MAETSMYPLDKCKLVEKDGSGNLQLLPDNLSRFLEQLHITKDDADTPIVPVCILGPKLSGKSFFTNLLVEYLKFGGRGWTKEMKEKGLKGFAYGPENNRVKSFGSDESDFEEDDGVYCWPELFPLEAYCSEKKHVLVIHLQHRQFFGQEGDSPGEDPLSMFAWVACSRLVEIIWIDKMRDAEMSFCRKVLEPYLCQSIIRLHRGSSPEENGCQNFDIIAMKDLPSDLHDQAGVLCFNLQQQQIVDRLMKKFVKESELRAKQFGEKRDVLNIENLTEFLQFCVDLVNNRKSLIKTTASEAADVGNHVCENGNDVQENGESIYLQHGCCGDDLVKKFSSLQIDETSENTGNDDSDVTRDDPMMETAGEPMEFSDADNSNTLTKPLSNLELLKQEIMTRPLWPGFQQYLENWIYENLNRSNIGDIPCMFDSIVETLKISYMKDLMANGMSNDEAKGFMNGTMIESKVKEVQAKVLKVKEALQQFCTKMEEQLVQHTSAPPKDALDTIVKKVAEWAVSSTGDTEVMTTIELGILKLRSYYESFFERYKREEENIVLECKRLLREFYRTEFSRYRPESTFQNPELMVKVHEQLVAGLKAVYEEALTHGNVIVSDHLESLKRDLENDLLEFEKSNMRKIEMAQRQVSKLVFKYKSKYEMQMDEFLGKSPNGVSSSIFDREDKRIETQIIAEFKTEVQVELNVDTFINKYVHQLIKHIENSRTSFQEENAENLQETNEKNNSDNSEACLQASKGSNSGNSGKGTNNLEHSQPLLVRLGQDKIGVGIFKNGAVSHIIYCVPVVGITQDNEWVCGNALQNLADPALLGKSWEIGNSIIHDEPGTVIGEANFNGTKSDITVELLLAIFLRSLSEAIQLEQQILISELLITVPFWYPSTHRQMVLDATQIAGFKKAHLINENSAAAYYMYERSSHESRFDTMVITENSKMVDITRYSFDIQQHKLIMLSHCGDCDTNNVPPEKDKHGIVKRFFSLLMHLVGIHKNASKNEQDLVMSKMVKMCEKAQARAVNMHPGVKSKLIKILICCESENHFDFLKTVVDKFGIGVDVLTNHEAPIKGLGLIYKRLISHGVNPNDILKDGMPYYVNVYSPSSERQVAFTKKNSFLLDSKYDTGVCSFSPEFGEYFVTQENVFTNSKLASFHIKPPSTGQCYRQFRLKLTKSSEGIIRFLSMTWTRTFTDLPIKIKCNQNEVEWKYNNLDDLAKTKHISLMDFVSFYNDKLSKIRKEKQCLEVRCTSMIQAINENQGDFNGNAIVRQLVLTNVNLALQQVRSAEITEIELKQQQDSLNAICAAYKLSF